MELSNETQKKLERYVNLLVNYPVNLTAYKDVNSAYENLILDSLIPIFSDNGFSSSKKVVDVGTGGVIPGLVWAICFPEKFFYLVESVKKKAAAIKSFIEELNLKNVKVFDERVEDFAKRYREYFDYATCRALARGDIALEYLTPLVKIQGLVSLFKGPNVFHDEWEYIQKALNIFKLSQEKIIEYEIEGGKKKRYLLIFKKLEKTAKIYPREKGIPKKYPIGESI